jgi:hypothetical protein
LALAGGAYFLVSYQNSLQTDVAVTEEIATRVPEAAAELEDPSTAHPTSVTVVQQSASLRTETNVNDVMPTAAPSRGSEAPGARTLASNSVSREGLVRAEATALSDETPIENGRGAQEAVQSGIHSPQPDLNLRSLSMCSQV